MLRQADALVAAYPEAGLLLREERDGLYVLLGEDKVLFGPWGECPKASPYDPDDAPLCALFAQPYPLGSGGRRPAEGFDPGRVRSERLLRFLYGKNAAAVETHCEYVPFLGEKLLFTSRHGAAKALARVAGKLERIMRENPENEQYVLPTGGTYCWRKIKNSQRLSAHSFGVCIDLNIDKGLYWQWRPAPEAVDDAREKYPQAVVDAFESEGFIWGGKWSAFDFMHFEYRPELLPQAFQGGLDPERRRRF